VATPIGTFSTTGTREFTSVGDAQALVLDDASLGFPAPGSSDAVFEGYPPAEVTQVGLSKLPEAVRVSWAVQNEAAGPVTSYDVVTGLVSDLRASAGYNVASCVASDILGTAYDDSRRDPAPGKGYYYLVRASGPYGNGSYGPTELDAVSPCP